MTSSEDQFPNSLVLTEFHALLSYPDRVVGISLLNKGVMFVDDFKSSKKIRGMTRDLTTGKIYAFSEYDVFEYAVDREERNVWRDYLHKAQTNPAFYQLALKYCANDEDKMDEVQKFVKMHQTGPSVTLHMQYGIVLRMDILSCTIPPPLK